MAGFLARKQNPLSRQPLPGASTASTAAFWGRWTRFITDGDSSEVVRHAVRSAPPGYVGGQIGPSARYHLPCQRIIWAAPEGTFGAGEWRRVAGGPEPPEPATAGDSGAGALDHARGGAGIAHPHTTRPDGDEWLVSGVAGGVRPGWHDVGDLRETPPAVGGHHDGYVALRVQVRDPQVPVTVPRQPLVTGVANLGAGGKQPAGPGPPAVERHPQEQPLVVSLAGRAGHGRHILRIGGVNGDCVLGL